MEEKETQLNISDQNPEVKTMSNNNLEESMKEDNLEEERLDKSDDKHDERIHKCQLCHLSFVKREVLDAHVGQCDPFAQTFGTESLSKTELRKKQEQLKVAKKNEQGSKSNSGKVAEVKKDQDITVNGEIDSSPDSSRARRHRKRKIIDHDYVRDFSDRQKVRKKELIDSKNLELENNMDEHFLDGSDDHEQEVEEKVALKPRKIQSCPAVFLCPHCCTVDEDVDKIQNHIKTVHYKERISWKVLSKKYSKMHNVWMDPASDLKEGQRVCSSCKVDCKTTKQLQIHVNRYHAYLPFCCGICRLAFVSMEKARFHMNQIHINSGFISSDNQLVKSIDSMKQMTESQRKEKHILRKGKKVINAPDTSPSVLIESPRVIRVQVLNMGKSQKKKKCAKTESEIKMNVPEKSEFTDYHNITNTCNDSPSVLIKSPKVIRVPRVIRVPVLNCTSFELTNNHGKTEQYKNSAKKSVDTQEICEDQDRDDIEIKLNKMTKDQCVDQNERFNSDLGSGASTIDSKDEIETEQQQEVRFETETYRKKRTWFRQPACRNLFDFSSLEGVVFKCCFENCGKVLQNVEEWQEHIFNHKPGKKESLPLECIECCYSTDKKTLLNQHLLIQHNKLESVQVGMKHCQVVENKTFTSVQVVACVFCGFLKEIGHFTAAQHNCDRKRVYFYCLFCEEKDLVFENLQVHIKKKHTGMIIFHRENRIRYQKLRRAEKDPAFSINNTDTKCDKCGEDFEINEKLKLHVNEKHAKAPYSCGVCRQCYGRLSGLMEHMNKTHILPMVCKLCKRRFGDKENLARHETTHLGTRPFLCDICPARYSDLKGLAYHKKWKHSKKSTKTDAKPEQEQDAFICDVCGVTLQTRSQYNKHATTHESLVEDNLPEIICEICSKGFTNQRAYTRHLCTAKLKASVSSIIEGCSDVVKTVKEIFNKIKLDPTPGSGAIVRCALCNKDFKKNKYMYNHIRQIHIPNEGKKQHCDVCGSGFATKMQLRTHKRTHTAIKPYKCRLCGKSFRQLGHIKVHLLSHSSKLNFKCKLCPQAFKAKSSLGNHISVHSDVFPYKCFISSCKRTYVSLQCLLVHVRQCDAIENSDKKLECKICLHKIEDLKSGMSHMKSHGNDALYKCSSCSLDFVSYKKLYHHKAESDHFSRAELENAATRGYSTQNFKSVEVNDGVDLTILQQQYDYTPDVSETGKKNKLDTGDEVTAQTEHYVVEETEVDNVLDSDELINFSNHTQLVMKDVTHIEDSGMLNSVSYEKYLVEQVENQANNGNILANSIEDFPVHSREENYLIGLNVSEETDSVTQGLVYNHNATAVKNEKMKRSYTSEAKPKLNNNRRIVEPKTSRQDISTWSCSENIQNVTVIASNPAIDESAVLVTEQSLTKAKPESCLSRTVKRAEGKLQKNWEAMINENHPEINGISDENIANLKIFESGREVKVYVINEEGFEVPIQTYPESLQALLSTGNYSVEYSQAAFSALEYPKEITYIDGPTEDVSSSEILQEATNKIEFQQIPNNTDNEYTTDIYVINEIQPVENKNTSDVAVNFIDSGGKVRKIIDKRLQSKTSVMNVDKVYGVITDKDAKIGNCKKEMGEVNYKVRLGYYEDRSKQENLYPLKCDICHRSFRRNKDLNYHKKSHLPNDKKPFHCDQCGKAFTSKNNLNNHLVMHSGDRPHKCDKCEKSFKQLGHLQTHLRKHANYRPFKCTVCEKTFITNSQLKVHVQTHGTHSKQIFTNGVACSVCGNYCENEYKLHSHRIKHMSPEAQDELMRDYNAVEQDKPKTKHEKSAQKEYMCDICGKILNRPSELKEHQKTTHFQGAKSTCNLCSSEFISEKRLKAHIAAVHSAEKWQCHTCGKQLKTQTGFYAHMRLHKGPKYQCVRCEKSFVRKYVFLHHIPSCLGDEFLEKIQKYTC